MFPDIKMVIIDAMIEPINETKDRVNIASTDGKELMKEMFKKDLTLCPRSEPVFMVVVWL